MSKIVLALLFPPSLAGAFALILNVYAKTSEAQNATANLVNALVNLSMTIPENVLYFGFLALMIAIAYLVIQFASAGAKRVNAITTMQLKRISGRGSLVSNRLLQAGYDIIEVGDEQVYPRHAVRDTSSDSAQVRRERDAGENRKDVAGQDWHTVEYRGRNPMSELQISHREEDEVS